MHLDSLSAEDMLRVEIPSGVPLVYRFGSNLDVLGREWLGVPELKN
jgi:2,3-bisphosphoglycerate-dependent phosphoglycerate mutase